jgi:fucose 4-O-acetylase-like acetyltransferase
MKEHETSIISISGRQGCGSGISLLRFGRLDFGTTHLLFPWTQHTTSVTSKYLAQLDIALDELVANFLPLCILSFGSGKRTASDHHINNVGQNIYFSVSLSLPVWKLLYVVVISLILTNNIHCMLKTNTESIPCRTNGSSSLALPILHGRPKVSVVFAI